MVMAILKAIGRWKWLEPCDDLGQCDNRRTRSRSSERCTVHTSRVQWVHQETASALYILLQKSYAEYELHTSYDEQMT